MCRTGFLNRHTAHIPKWWRQLQHDYANVFATQFFNEDGSFYRTLINWDRLQKNTPDFDLAFSLKPRRCTHRKTDLLMRHPGLPGHPAQSQYFRGPRLRDRNGHLRLEVFRRPVRERHSTVRVEGLLRQQIRPDAHDLGVRTLTRFIGQDQIV
jgi:hypothetical protein